MKRRSGWLLCLAFVTVSVPVWAQHHTKPGLTAGTSSDSTPQTEDQLKAQQHFQRAKELYQAGSYREAIAELEIARKLDPKAKDLVMNLGIVHEKLGKFDEAITYVRAYLEMEGITPQERVKAEGMLKRLEGAKREVPAPTASSSSKPSQKPAASASASTPPPPVPPRKAERGRVDGVTITFGALAGVGLLTGTAFGIYALMSRPSDGFVTGRDGSYQDFRDDTDSAHTAAIVADISLGAAATLAVMTALLYFGRPKTDAESRTMIRAREPKHGLTVYPGLSGISGVF